MYRYERSGVLHGLLAHPGLHPGRQPHLLHAGPDRPRADVAARLRAADPADLRLRASSRPSSSTRPEEKSVGVRRGLGTGHRRPARGAAGTRACPTRSPRARAPSTAPRSTSTCRTPSAGAGSCRPSRSTSTTRSASTSTYIGADNERHRPIMIHRALFGSVERFFGILVEHYAGAFPTWLAPVQVQVLPVADRHDDYAARVVDRLRAAGFRAEVTDASHDTLGARVRQGQDREDPLPARGRRLRRRGRDRRASTCGAASGPSATSPSTTSSPGWPPRWRPAVVTLDRLWAGWRSRLHLRDRRRRGRLPVLHAAVAARTRRRSSWSGRHSASPSSTPSRTRPAT